MAKFNRGEYGYIRDRKKRLLITTGILLAALLAAFFLGLILFNTRLNLLTLLAALLVIPMANFLVSYIALMKSITPSSQEKDDVDAAAGDWPVLYELTIPDEKRIFFAPYAICEDHEVLMYFPKKEKLEQAQSFIKDKLKRQGLNAKVKLCADRNEFLKEVHKLPPKEEDRAEEKDAALEKLLTSVIQLSM